MRPLTWNQVTAIVRAVQFVCALAAMSTLGSAFVSISYPPGDGYGSYGTAIISSHITNFALLLNYTALSYSLFVLVAVERLQVVPRFSVKVDRIVDTVMAALLLGVGMAVATSNLATLCYGVVRCLNMTGSAVFMFLGTLAFLASLTISFLAQNKGPSGMPNAQPSPQYVSYEEGSGPSKGTNDNGTEV